MIAHDSPSLFEALPTIRATLALTSRVSRLSKGRGIRSERLKPSYLSSERYSSSYWLLRHGPNRSLPRRPERRLGLVASASEAATEIRDDPDPKTSDFPHRRKPIGSKLRLVRSA